MEITKPLIIQCNECEEIIEIDTDMEYVSSYERSMGSELEYEALVEDLCPNCGNPLSIHISAWEYPVGAFEFSETQIDGAELLEDAEFSAWDD